MIQAGTDFESVPSFPRHLAAIHAPAAIAAAPATRDSVRECGTSRSSSAYTMSPAIHPLSLIHI